MSEGHSLGSALPLFPPRASVSPFLSSSPTSDGESHIDLESCKRIVGHHAATLIPDGAVVGLGTGSTARYLIEAIAELRDQGQLTHIFGVPTSEQTRRQAEAVGIPLTDLARHPVVEIAIDGADEVDPNLDLIKGLGGALLREKLVVIAATRFVVMIDESKLVSGLGTRSPLPVEVDRFGAAIQEPFLRGLGCEPVLRRSGAGEPARTDGGHYIFDCHFDQGIRDPQGLALELDRRPGIFEHGLFLGLADTVLVGSERGVETRRRNPGDSR